MCSGHCFFLSAGIELGSVFVVVVQANTHFLSFTQPVWQAMTETHTKQDQSLFSFFFLLGE